MFRLYRYPEPTGGNPPANPPTPPNPAPPATPPAPPTPPAGGQQADPGNQGKTFTQEQLDHIMSERLSREREKFKDYDELKRYREEQEAKSKTDLEKANDARVKAENEAKRVKEESTQRLLLAEARAVAAELGFTKPEKAIKLAEFKDAVKDGEIDPAKVKAALDALAKDMPELIGKPAPPTGPTNPPKGGAPAGGESDAERRSRLFGGGGRA